MTSFVTTPGPPSPTLTPHTDAPSDRANVVTEAVDVIIVAVTGEIDIDTAAALHTRLIEAIDRGDQVCCDLSQVTFFGAAAANTLLVAHCHATACGRRFSVRGVHGLTGCVITTTGLDRVLTIQD